MFAIRLPWVSIAARGLPAVPLVKINVDRWSGSTSTRSTGSAASRSSMSTSPSDACAGSQVMTVVTEGTFDRSTFAHVAALNFSITTTDAPTFAISGSSSRAGLSGLSGTTTAPSPSVA